MSLQSAIPGSSTASQANIETVASSADGALLFLEVAASETGLVPGINDNNNADDIFVRTVSSDSNAPLVTAAANSGPSINPHSRSPGSFADSRLLISGSGARVLLSSADTSLVSGQVDTPATTDLFVHDVAESRYYLINNNGDGVTRAGAVGQLAQSSARISRAGNHVLFRGSAADYGFTDNATDTEDDLLLRDLRDNSIRLINHVPGDPQTAVAGSSTGLDLSADGSRVAFSHDSAEFGFTQGSGGDLIVYDVPTQQFTLVTRRADNASQGAGGATNIPFSLSADGRAVVFSHQGGSPDPFGFTDSNNSADIYHYDIASNTLSLVSHATGSTTTAANGFSLLGDVSANGQVVLFSSNAPDFGFNDGNNAFDVVLYDHSDASLTLVSRSGPDANVPLDTNSTVGLLSADGRYATFTNRGSTNHGFTDPSPSTADTHAFVFDRVSGTVSAINHPPGDRNTLTDAGVQGLTGGGAVPSYDGSTVVFAKNEGSELITGLSESPQKLDSRPPVFIHDVATGTNTALTVRHDDSGTLSNSGAQALVAINQTGSLVYFESHSTDLTTTRVPSTSDNYGVLLGEPVSATIDFGDAPDPSYPSLLANDGARHVVGTLFLGAGIDAESDALTNSDASGDGAEDDGISGADVLVRGTTSSISVQTSQASGKLNAFIDWNADGDWADTGEQVFNDVTMSATSTPLEFAVPTNAAVGDTFARVRLSTAGGDGVTGEAADGEVEDYQLDVRAPTLTGEDVTVTEPDVGSNATVQVTYTLSQAVSEDLSFTVTGVGISGDTATRDEDFVGATSELTIPAGETTAIYTAEIIGDHRFEEDEVFTLQITNPGFAAFVNSGTHTVTIENDDPPPPVVTLSATKNSLQEGESADLTVTLSPAQKDPYSVSLVIGGEAEQDDLQLTAGTIVIAAGMTTGSDTLTAAQDTIFEGAEAAEVTAMGANTLSIDIVDDDSEPSVSLSLSQASFGENGGTTEVIATLSNPSEFAVSGEITFAGAAQSSDYQIDTTTLSFAPLATSARATLTGIDDSVYEGDETVEATLGKVSGGTAGSPASVTATLSDDEASPQVTLSADAESIAEAGGMVTVTATVDQAAAVPVSLTLSLGGAATAGTDYEHGALSLSIPAGQSSASTHFTATEDADDEPNEALLIGIANLSGATAGTPSGLTLQILDDDPTPSGSSTPGVINERKEVEDRSGVSGVPDVAMMSFGVRNTSSVTANLTRVGTRITGALRANRLKLYRDTNGDGALDPGEPLIASVDNESPTTLFFELSAPLQIPAGQTERFVVLGDF